MTEPTIFQPCPGKMLDFNLPYCHLPQCSIPTMGECGCLSSLLVPVYNGLRVESTSIGWQDTLASSLERLTNKLATRPLRLIAVLSADFLGPYTR